MKHVTVYKEPERYAGWPANYGIWSWGDEIVVCFTVGYHQPDAEFHARDKDRPFETMQGRSVDGGHTWQVGPMPCRTPGNRALSADEHMRPHMGAQQALETGLAAQPEPCPGVDFAHSDFALMCARTGLGIGAVSWFYTSQDRCQTWDGPFSLPVFGMEGTEARTDYLVSSADQCLLFLAGRQDGKRVFCVRTQDGGKTFAFVAHVSDGIMPSSVRLSETRLLTASRVWEGERCGVALFASDDNGTSWRYLCQPFPGTINNGNPGTLNQLHDGRLCLIYGYRETPYGIRTRLSEDEGATWGDEIILRDDGGNHDLGYPRTIQRTDGTVVTVYYFNDSAETERYIGATHWKP